MTARIEEAVTAVTDAAAAAKDALRDTPTALLLRSAYSLTHKIHAELDVMRDARASGYASLADSAAGKVEDYRAQRNLIDAEILRRAGRGRRCTEGKD